MIRKYAKFLVALSAVLSVATISVSSSDAKTVSINFQSNSGAVDLLLPGDVAGYYPVANWNNLNANSGVLNGTIAGQLIDSTGADSGMIFSWGSQGGRAANTPVIPATSGDQKLFFGGREGDINAGNQTTAQFKLENMSTAFPSGYDVIWYFGDSGLTFQAGFGVGYRTTDGSVFTFNNASTDPSEVTLQLGTTVIPGNQAGTANNVAFNGTYTFTPNGNSFLDVGLADDTLVYSFRQKAGGSSFWGLMNVGVQIVGPEAEPEAVPEPSTYALGLLGLTGFGLIVWRRRRRS